MLPVRLFTQINLPYLARDIVGTGDSSNHIQQGLLLEKEMGPNILCTVLQALPWCFVLKTLAYLKYIEEPVVITITGQLVFFLFPGYDLF